MEKKIKRFLSDNDRFAKHSGIELVEVAKGYAKAKMTVADYHLNGVKMVHGGAIFTLADYAFGAASNSHGRVAVGINTTITYMRAATGGVLYAEAKEVSLTAKLGIYTVNITDESNQLLAIFQGTTYRKKEEYSL